jgi:2-oxo-4-hydroxy-4-carboxy-5-ureidoimidazoline decarboxylase
LSFSIAQLNRLSHAEFVEAVGPVFEKSPWIAAEIAAGRPFADFESLRQALCERVRRGTPAEQMALIRAHPDLVGRLTLTAESQREQASAGLQHLTPAEVEIFRARNSAYRERFGFPFIICARLNKKEAILAGFAKRLPQSRADEIKTALEEIFKIAELRLRDIVV